MLVWSTKRSWRSARKRNERERKRSSGSLPERKALKWRNLSLRAPLPVWLPKMTRAPRTKQRLLDSKRLAGRRSPPCQNLPTQTRSAQVGHRSARLHPCPPTHLRLPQMMLLSLHRRLRDPISRLAHPCFVLEDGHLWILAALDPPFPRPHLLYH